MMVKKLITLLFFLPALLLSAQDKVPLKVSFPLQDSVVTYASRQYQPKSFLRRVLMGNNYRKEWKEPVKLPVFHFSTSGFRILELGGGMQTKSLHIVDSAGKQWALRTVDKDVSGALPPGIRNTLARRASQDLISAAFPYGAPVAGALVNSVGVKAANPQVVFVADDPALDSFRSIFANTICTLEERDPGFADTDNTETMYQHLTTSPLYKIQQPVFLKARLMDMLMADWDRHEDNWRWGVKDSAGLKFYYAIPRDRDWVFYKSKGWIPKVVQLSGAMRCFINFGPKVNNIKNLSWKAWALDRNLLNEMSAVDWEQAIREIQTTLTDAAIEEAVRKFPAAIYEMDGAEFISTLKSRRDGLKEGVMKYYRFLTEEVVVNGSDEEELFTVTSHDDNLQVTVYSATSKQKLYERKFSAEETYFITLNGKGGKDVFDISQDDLSKIRLVVNGGDGDDIYRVKGGNKTTINDTETGNSVEESGKAKLIFK
jgi:hypothetical protein